MPQSMLEITKTRKHVVCVTLNRPTSANAFNTQMAREIMEFFETIALNNSWDSRWDNGGQNNPEDIRCVIITGAGEKAFCAGADLKERHGMTEQDWRLQHLIYERMIRAIVNCPVPIIAAVNGAAYAGGCEIAAATDFIYAADHAKFAQTETRIGIIPGAGGTQTLARAMGERRAKEIIMSARPFSAQDGYDWGLVNQVMPLADLMEQALATAEGIASNAPIAVRQSKQAIYRGAQMSLSDGLAFEIEAYNRTIDTADRHEGVRAFNEKRPPQFKGE